MSDEKVEKPAPKIVDDRDEEIEVIYGKSAKTFVSYTLSKKQAFNDMVVFYRRQKIKIVPRLDLRGRKINQAVCYCKVTKVDWDTGEDVISYKELPIHIAVERKINFKGACELITKQEVEAYYEERGRIEKKWRDTQFEESRKKAIANIADMQDTTLHTIVEPPTIKEEPKEETNDKS